MSFVKTPQELLQISQTRTEFYNAEMVFAFWLTRPEIVEHLLPPPLQPADMPLVSAFVASYPQTSFGPPYYEGALCLSAQYQGVLGNYCLAMPVTDDMAMASGREYFGFPTKMAERIQLDRSGDGLLGYVERKGILFFELEFTPDEKSVDESFKTLIRMGFAFHQETGACTFLFNQMSDYPPRMIRQNTIFRPKTIEFGQAQVKMMPSSCDPWYEVEVVNTVGGMRIIGDNTMLSAQVLSEVDPVAFAPYSFTRWDW